MIEEDYVSFETAKLLKEKAAAYDEAIKRVEDIKTGKCETTFVFTEGLFEHIFPELKEDEDERIRKELYDFCIKCSHGDTLVNKQADFQKWAAWLEKQGEQKPVEWSDKNEAVLDALIRRLEGEDIYVSPHLAAECIKSLKDRVLPQQKQVWNEEDEIALGDALWCCKQAASIAKDENDMGNVWYAERWLKSLRPQNKWKPSEEQMKFLYKYAEQNNYDGAILTSLYKQLKQL